MQTNGTQSKEPRTIYGSCPWCNHEIQPGEPAVVLMLHVERQDPDFKGIPEIDILDADGVIALCRDCGDALDGERLRRLIYSHYEPGAESWS